jgi:hypothetical protein
MILNWPLLGQRSGQDPLQHIAIAQRSTQKEEKQKRIGAIRRLLASSISFASSSLTSSAFFVCSGAVDAN